MRPSRGYIEADLTDAVAVVSINPTKDLNNKIDAPAESEDALYG